jgi:hypothetical protein
MEAGENCLMKSFMFFYSLPHIIVVNKSRSKRLAEYAVCIGKKRNANGVFVGNPARKR